MRYRLHSLYNMTKLLDYLGKVIVYYASLKYEVQKHMEFCEIFVLAVFVLAVFY